MTNIELTENYKIRDRTEELQEIANRQILLLDGGMGTEIQALKLSEEDYRGERFRDHPNEMFGNNDVLALTQPKLILQIHRNYFEAGADIGETSTFAATSISQADYGLEGLAYEINFAAAQLLRQAAEEASTPDKPRFAAGILGPTNKTASISPDVNDPSYRDISFDELRASYGEAAAGLLDGGAEILLIETVFDTLNAKAAIFAVQELLLNRNFNVPVMVAGTITDKSGRTLSGQTPTAFWYSTKHAGPISVGLNCALGAEDMRQYVAELSSVADCLISAHPNAGLPNAFGDYEETPDYMASQIGEWAQSGIVNIVGGCCGTTPEHIKAMSNAVEGVSPRRPVESKKRLCLSGLEPFEV